MGELFRKNWKKITGIRSEDPTDDEEVVRLGDVFTVEGSAALANNQAAPANVDGLVFANADVRAFDALVAVEIDATADLYELFTLRGIQIASGWTLDSDAVGDTSGVAFTITSAGQVQYTSTNASGYVSSVCKYKAITLSA